MTQWDPRRILDFNGRWAAVKKFERTYFEDYNAEPIYVSIDALAAGCLRAV